MTNTVHINLQDRSYDILIEPGLLARCAEPIRTVLQSRRCMVITNDIVKQWYLEPVLASLADAGIDAAPYILPDGEQVKSVGHLESIWHAMLDARLDRHCFVVALGGGVVGDLAGFAAATYMRGIPFVQIPTTLLAQVDSSVGGKTGINLREGKNLIGAFYQPRCVIIDPNVLQTLDIRQLRAGFAEVIKYGMIYDASFFAYLETHLERIVSLELSPVEHSIALSCRIKAQVVEQDERESGLRAILNFGHTVGHALEAITQYGRFVHGEAVAVGMVAACSLAEQVLGFDRYATQRLIDIVKRSGLPSEIPSDIDNDTIIGYMRRDKKVKDDVIRFVLPDSIGSVRIVSDVPLGVIRDALDQHRSS